MARECEAKLRVDSLDAIRNRLTALGAANEGDCLEKNWVLDDSSGRLAKQGKLLRVRSLGDAGGILTVKTPLPGGEFKNREEIETMVDSTEDLLRQLQTVGFHVAWIYEKKRQTWLWSDCVLALDECPEMGTFVEIEGTPDRIKSVAAELGLDPELHIEDNYLTLWKKHIEETGQRPRHMLFDPYEKV